MGAHLAAGAHEILQHAEVALGGSPTQPLYSIDRGELRSRPPQPGDTREGFQQACESMSQGLERTASSLLGNPLKVYQRGAGAGLAVASALWAAPAAAVAPASAAAVAVQRALLGVRNGYFVFPTILPIMAFPFFSPVSQIYNRVELLAVVSLCNRERVESTVWDTQSINPLFWCLWMCRLDPEHKWESDQKHTGPPPDVRRSW